MCWYHDHFEFWSNNPELLKREVAWQEAEQEGSALRRNHLVKQISSGRIKAHRISKKRYECWAEGFVRASGPVTEDRMCFGCKKGIDE